MIEFVWQCQIDGNDFFYWIHSKQAGAPMWEDFLSKAAKLHTALKWVDRIFFFK